VKAAINVRNLLFRTARTTGYRVGLGGEKSNDSTLRKIKFFHKDKRIFFPLSHSARCGSTSRKTKVGPPRRRGPKLQARMRRFAYGGQLRRANRTAAARHPYLGSTMGAVAPRCGSTLRRTMVGLPRRRGPKIQARMRRLKDRSQWSLNLRRFTRWVSQEKTL